MDRIYVMELVRSYQCGAMDRRQFLAQASKALGGMAAAQMLLTACGQPQPNEPPPPVVVTPSAAVDAGQTIPIPTAASGGSTGAAPESSAGVTANTVEYPDADGETLMGYLARPEGGSGLPGVIVIQEWWGLNEHIRDVTRRFAQEGFVALAPDLYHGAVTSEPNEARKLVMELDMEEAVREIQQAIDFLQQQPGVAGPKVGVVGFCMGGRLVLQTARAEEDLGAAVAFYGSPLTPEEAKEVKAPVLGLYGENDSGIPVAGVRAMEEGFKAAGIEHEIQVYPGAAHAFFNETRAESYNEAAAQDAWTRTLAWFRSRLPG